MAKNRYKQAKKVFPIGLGPGDRAFEPGFSYSLSIAAQILRLSFSTYLFDKHRLDIVIFAESQYN